MAEEQKKKIKRSDYIREAELRGIETRNRLTRDIAADVVRFDRARARVGEDAQAAVEQFVGSRAQEQNPFNTEIKMELGGTLPATSLFGNPRTAPGTSSGGGAPTSPTVSLHVCVSGVPVGPLKFYVESVP